MNKPTGPITKQESELITYIYASGLNTYTDGVARSVDITDLSGIENLINITYLDFTEHKIIDLTPLSNLNNLKTLRLIANEITDVTPLSNLVNLEYLYLDANDIEDLSPLDNLENLIILSTSDSWQ